MTSGVWGGWGVRRGSPDDLPWLRTKAQVSGGRSHGQVTLLGAGLGKVSFGAWCRREEGQDSWIKHLGVSQKTYHGAVFLSGEPSVDLRV